MAQVSASVACSGRPQVRHPVSPRNSIPVQHSLQKLCTSETIVPHPAQRGGSAKSSAHREQFLSAAVIIARLLPDARRRTSAHMAELFDLNLRAQRRDRAARMGPELFLLERAFDDCLERLSLVQRRFARALLIGCPDPGWPERLASVVDAVSVLDPASAFARAAGGTQVVEDSWQPAPGEHDLVLAIGTLDTVNDLRRVLLAIRWAMQPQGLFIGAMSGGETMPQLRAAMREADSIDGAATPHVHPRIEASAVAPLLSGAGFNHPVVDVDRVAVSYRSLDRLIRDLRHMGATNVLLQRSRTSLSRRAYAAASECFARSGDGGRTTESFEILHFACWSPPSTQA